jgi:poly(3-hydroxybutyrate) depolymerase
MKNLSRLLAFFVVIAVFAALGYALTIRSGINKLASYQIDIRQTSVSGISSGAYMAGQFQLAHSSIMVGAGIIAGGPYFCAGSYATIPYVTTALTTCMNPKLTTPDGEALALHAKSFAEAGLIDDLANLNKEKIYLFSGKKDRVVAMSVVDQAAAFYKKAGVPSENIQYISNMDAGHAVLTDNNRDLSCAATASPYLNNCHYAQSHEILRHIYGKLNPPVGQVGQRSGKMIKFNQTEFDQSPLSGMSETAYAYVPHSCKTQTCRVHIVFHGCAQGASDIGDRFHEDAGYNEIADTNNIIVLYPQVRRSSMMPSNPGGCWDFWGYSSSNPLAPDFYTKRAPQIAAVKAMLDRLAAPRQ